MDKIWKVAKPINNEIKNQFPEINPIVLQLLHDRGLNTQAEVDEFLNPDYGQDVHDPFLFLDMDKAVSRIFRAIKNKERVMVYGDYDADGVCSSVLLVSLLKAFGLKPEVYIPDRETEGYGLNFKSVQEIIDKKINLVITVDCGVTNIDEIDYLIKNNIDVIVTDHHQQLKDLPGTYIVINPKIKKQTYPFYELSGCGVAFKLAQGLLSEKSRKQYPELKFPAIGFEKWFLDLVAIATVADLSPLLGENRTLVKYGLIVLKKTRRKGILALINTTGKEILNLDTQAISFLLAPRINSAGRVDHASSAYELLLTDNQAKAEKISKELNSKNIERQQITERIYRAVKEQLGEIKNQLILFASGEGWLGGVIGLVAGKLSDEFHRPTLIMSKSKSGEITGSGRSIKKFNITEALEKCKEYLSQYGGHSQACGFTLKNEAVINNFKQKITELVADSLTKEDLRPVLEISCELKLSEVNWDLYKEIEIFEPFGQGNFRPIFLARKLKVVNLQSVGKDNKHLRIMVSDEKGITRKTIGFCFGNWCERIKAGDTIDLVFEVGVNTWNGNQELQLKIIDLKKNEIKNLKFLC